MGTHLASRQAWVDGAPGLGPKRIKAAVGVQRSLFCCAVQAECVKVQVSAKLPLSGLLGRSPLYGAFWLTSLLPGSL